MKTIRIINGAYGQRVNGRTVPVRLGGTCQVDGQEAARLVALKVAAFVEDAEAVPESSKVEPKDKVDSGDELEPTASTPAVIASPSPDELNAMTKTELIRLAASMGLEANDRMNKPAIIQMIAGAGTSEEEAGPPALSPEDPVV